MRLCLWRSAVLPNIASPFPFSARARRPALFSSAKGRSSAGSGRSRSAVACVAGRPLRGTRWNVLEEGTKNETERGQTRPRSYDLRKKWESERERERKSIVPLRFFSPKSSGSCPPNRISSRRIVELWSFRESQREVRGALGFRAAGFRFLFSLSGSRYYYSGGEVGEKRCVAH